MIKKKNVLIIGGLGQVGKELTKFLLKKGNKVHVITNEEQASKSAWSPYDGKKITGMPIMTIIRGNIVMRESELLEKIIAQPIEFNIR